MRGNQPLTEYWHCRKCGKKSLLDAVTCSQCGANLALYGEMVTKETLPPKPPKPPKPEPPKPENRHTSPSRKGWLLALVAILAVALFAAWRLSNSELSDKDLQLQEPPKSTSTPTTIPATALTTPPATAPTTPSTTAPTTEATTAPTNNSENTGSPGGYTLSHVDVTLLVGETFNLLLKDIHGNAVPIDWLTSNSCCTVSGNTVKGVTAGTTTIYALYDGVEYTCVVRIR